MLIYLIKNPHSLVAGIIFICFSYVTLNASIGKNKQENIGDNIKTDQNDLNDLRKLLEKEVNENTNDDLFDSLIYVKYSDLESSFDSEKLLELNKIYFDLVETEGDLVKYETMVERTDELLSENNRYDKSELWLSISNSAARLRKSNIANKYALRALAETQFEKKTEDMVEINLALGKSLELKKSYKEAFQNYLNASYLVQTLDDTLTKINYQKLCFNHLFDFHINIKDFDQAAKNKKQEIDLIELGKPIDSLELYWAKYDLVGLNILSGKYGNLIPMLDDILRYSYKVNNVKLREFTFSVYRSFLIETNNHDGFNHLYVNKHPEELVKLQGAQPVTFHLINSKLAEYFVDYDKAIEEFKNASILIEQSNNLYFKSNFFKRYGEFLVKYDKDDEAEQAFKKAYDFAAQIDYLDFMLETSDALDSLYFVNQNLKKLICFLILIRNYLLDNQN